MRDSLNAVAVPHDRDLGGCAIRVFKVYDSGVQYLARLIRGLEFHHPLPGVVGAARVHIDRVDAIQFLQFCLDHAVVFVVHKVDGFLPVVCQPKAPTDAVV